MTIEGASNGENRFGWRFDTSYKTLPSALYTELKPTAVAAPKLTIFNHELAKDLGLNPEAFDSENGVAQLSGNLVPEGATPLAQAYAGHQYANFVILGDGRAILLGEHIAPEGLRYDIQLKGPGRTPYSRGGDGRAALGPMLREYLISEAMAGLGIPTTRSLAVVSTGETIQRETRLPGAVLTRVAASHIRVGTFQWVAAKEDPALMQALLTYAMKRHEPQCLQMEHPGKAFLEAVIEKQAALIAQWQLVGFVHGVMNTDNMAISGETIDYGPCAFMDTYHPGTVFSSIDRRGRYAYGNQPSIAGWNLARLAEALIPVLHEDQDTAIAMAQEALNTFMPHFQNYWVAGLRRKLGLQTAEDNIETLIETLLTHMMEAGLDYTLTFRQLMAYLETQVLPEPLVGLESWLNDWRTLVTQQEGGVALALELMAQVNPAVIPRQHWVEKALAEAETGDLTLFETLLDYLKDPYSDVAANSFLAQLPPQKSETYTTYCGT